MSGRARAYLWLAAFFLLGSMGGAALGRVYAQHELGAALFSGEHQDRDRFFVGAVARQLELSAPQRERVDEIFERYRSQRRELMNRLFETCGSPMEALQNEMDAEMATVLDANQAEKWREFTERRRRERFGESRSK